MSTENSSTPNRPLLSDNDRLRLIEENVRDYAILTVTLDGKIASWGIGAERILGYHETEVLGRPFAEIFTPEDRDSGIPERELNNAAITGRAEDERWHLRKDDSRFWASGILTALRDGENGNTLRGYVKILRDITEAKTQRTHIEELNARLRAALTEIHHRVKNNLQVISGMLDLQMLEHGEFIPITEARRLSEQIRTISIIHDILTHQTREEDPTAKISARPILDRLLPHLAMAAGRESVESEIADVPLTGKQAISLALVVAELYSNAVKHGQGSVGVLLHQTTDGSVLEVFDDGPGFPANFDPEISANTGLMLIDTLVRHDLGGSVTFGNDATGARVRVIIPSSEPVH